MSILANKMDISPFKTTFLYSRKVATKKNGTGPLGPAPFFFGVYNNGDINGNVGRIEN